MSSRQTWEKLYRAVHTLTVANAPLRDRLGSAFRSDLVELTPDDFAEAELENDFESLYVDADSGRVLRTEWLSEAECTHAADTILHLFIEISRKIEQEDYEGWLKNRLLGGA